MKIFYNFDGGYCIHYGNWPRYVGYSKREAFSRFRKQYGLERKHIKFVNEADAPGLMECVRQLAALERQTRTA